MYGHVVSHSNDFARSSDERKPLTARVPVERTVCRVMEVLRRARGAEGEMDTRERPSLIEDRDKIHV